MHFLCFYPFFELTAWKPYRLSHVNTLCIKLFYLLKDQSLKFLQINIENWRSWKMTFFGFLVIGFFNFVFLFFLNENQLGFHMRYHLFLHYWWFIQNLGKDFIQINNAYNFRFFIHLKKCFNDLDVSKQNILTRLTNLYQI